MVAFGQRSCIWAKMVEIGEKWLYPGKGFCIRAKVVVFEQIGCIRAKWEYSGKVVVNGQKWLYLGKLVVFGEKWL